MVQRPRPDLRIPTGGGSNGDPYLDRASPSRAWATASFKSGSFWRSTSSITAVAMPAASIWT